MLAILKRLAAAENELKEIRLQLIQAMNETAHADGASRDLGIGYTLDDLFKSFGNSKKHYATRLSRSLQKRGITTLQEFLALTPGQLLDLENVSVGTLEQTKKALDRLGISW